MSIYEHAVTTIDGRDTTLDEFRGQVLLIVNVASKCGFTPQYKGLEELHKKYADQGLAVLGFPCNQFGSQEPGSEADIQSFCSLTYDVSFPMFSKVKVNGPEAHPLYQELKSSQKGLLGSEGIKWNFTKFLVNRKGEVVGRYGSVDKPESLAKDIEPLLAESA